MILALDSNGHILFANQAFLSIYHLEKDEVNGRNFANLLSAEDSQHWVNAYHSAKKGTPALVELDNGKKIFELAVSPIQNNPEMDQVVISARDVTIRQYTEVAFQQSNDELRHIILELGTLNRITHIIATEDLSDALPNVALRIRNLFDLFSTTIVLYDRQEQHFQVLADVRRESENNGRLVGIKIPLSDISIREETLTTSETIFLPLYKESAGPLADYLKKLIPDYPKAHIAFIPLCVRHKVVGYIVISVIKDFQQLQLHTPSLETIAQQIASYIDNARLLRQEKKQRQLLERQNDELDAFARMVAHDLKGPLHTLVGFSEMLANYRDQFPPEQQEEILKRISNGASRMSRIVDELLLLSQIDRLQIHNTPINTAMLVEQAIESVDYLRQDYQGEIILPASWPNLQSYEPWLHEVWCNFLSNAIKYGGRPYRVELGADEQDNEMIRFWVADNGRGIPQNHFSRLFVEFERLPETQELPGTGLGLSIVKRIINHLGGEVGVESEVGQGSKFYFDLPKIPPTDRNQ